MISIWNALPCPFLKVLFVIGICFGMYLFTKTCLELIFRKDRK